MTVTFGYPNLQNVAEKPASHTVRTVFKIQSMTGAVRRPAAGAPDGRLGLDDPANDQLRAVRLADDAITVRELLRYTSGVN